MICLDFLDVSNILHLTCALCHCICNFLGYAGCLLHLVLPDSLLFCCCLLHCLNSTSVVALQFQPFCWVSFSKIIYNSLVTKIHLLHDIHHSCHHDQSSLFFSFFLSFFCKLVCTFVSYLLCWDSSMTQVSSFFCERTFQLSPCLLSFLFCFPFVNCFSISPLAFIITSAELIISALLVT